MLLRNDYGIVDPRAILKEAKRRGIVHTMVSYEEVSTIATTVVKLRLKFNHK